MKNKRFYFIGIGGIGMSSIARFLMQKGAEVAGYDKTSTPLTKALEDTGVQITYDASVETIPQGFETKETSVIFTPAVPATHPQKHYFETQGNIVQKRAVFLGEITRNIPTLAVAGTHGKTTTTAILAHLFSATKQLFTAFVGGLVQGKNSNLISSGMNTILVEADEFDRSFLQLHPSLACITSIDPDHLDIYGTKAEVEMAYRQFFDQIQSVGIVEKNIPFPGITYSIQEQADYCISNLTPEGFGYRFNLHTPKNTFNAVYFSQLGLHNLSNALAAFALASQHGLEEKDLADALSSFQGVERRLQLLLDTPKHLLIDDYAHHPTEIMAVYETLENAYPDEKKCVVFQPHLYSRTQDFMTAFASSLSCFDQVFILPIYPARELPIAGVSSTALAEKIAVNKEVRLLHKEEIYGALKESPARIKVLLGAGDIGLEVADLQQKLSQNENV